MLSAAARYSAQSSSPVAQVAATTMTSMTATLAICNQSSAEDMCPLVTDSGCIVADGHKGQGCGKNEGRGCVDALTHHGENLKTMLDQQGPLAVVNHSKALCCKEKSGAMIAAVKVTGDEIIVASLGDCAVFIYQANALLHAQPHHDKEYFLEHATDLRDRGITPYFAGKRQPQMGVDGAYTVEKSACSDEPGTKPGTNLEKNTHRAFTDPYSSVYFRSQNGQTSFACCGGLGHYVRKTHLNGLEEKYQEYHGADPIVTCTQVDVTKAFTVVAASDGFGDVWHENDPFLLTGEYDAEKLLELSNDRWLKPRQLNSETFGHFAGDNFVFAKTPKDADDISITVLRYDPTGAETSGVGETRKATKRPRDSGDGKRPQKSQRV